MTILVAVILWMSVGGVLLALTYRRALSAAWREPVLRAPVLILESDDWGYGPLVQAGQLDRIAAVLSRFRDYQERHPVMTLGVVLAGPDTDRMRSDECREYHRLTLADPRLAPIRDAMLRGVTRGVYALQLHGLEHYWPACLMQASRTSEPIRNWLTELGFPRTEELPPALQSRWIDSTELPTKPLASDQVASAAGEESELFVATFGTRPEVAVPPTFVWTDDVESAWSRAGIQVVVTPGLRNESRDQSNHLVPGDRECFNGATGSDRLIYVVRNHYFEPALGHTHLQAMEALRRCTHLGRPTLLEFHRANFIGDDRAADGAVEELVRLFESAIVRYPDLRFMSTAELARHYRGRSQLLQTGIPALLHFLLRRLAENSRLRKLSWLTGLIIPAWLAYLATWPRGLGRSP